MVDALQEIWRVLSANGILLDLRPLHTRQSPIEVVTPEEAVRVGEVDVSGAATDDVAADRAIERVVESGWFVFCRDARFEFELCSDHVGEIACFIEGSTRLRHVRPSYADLERAHRELVAESGDGARIRYRRPMRLAVYRKACPRPRAGAAMTTRAGSRI